jgi:hypothetical protein
MGTAGDELEAGALKLQPIWLGGEAPPQAPISHAAPLAVPLVLPAPLNGEPDCN